MEHIDDLCWRKARKSGGNGGNCVEVGTAGRTSTVAVRDTKSRERGMLAVAPSTWKRFMDEIKDGRYRLLHLGLTGHPLQGHIRVSGALIAGRAQTASGGTRGSAPVGLSTPETP
jgi:hypothetical protein